jgi:outer membrane protein
MSKFNVLIFLLLIFTYIPAKAIAADKVKIGIVNLDRAGRESKRGKEIVEVMKRRIKKEQEMIKKKESKVKELRKDLNKQGLIMSEELKRKKEADFRTESRNLQRHIKDAEEEIRIKQREATNKILKELLEIVKEIGKKDRYTYITSSEFTVYSDKAIDISDKVIREYNRKYRKKKSSK